jgi:thioredoxin 1
MKPWMAIVIVLAVLTGGMFLMAPRDAKDSPGAAPAVAGSKATDDKISTISRGERVEIPEHLKDGRFTIVEFGADWCPGCRQLKPQVEAAVEHRDGVVLRQIDIRSWTSEAARQHGIQSIPQLWLYDGTKLVTTDTERVIGFLQKT